MNVWNHINGCDCAATMAAGDSATAPFPAGPERAPAPTYPMPLLDADGMAYCEYDEEKVRLNADGSCPLCGHDVDIRMDEHRVVSVSGWTCDICGVTVNGQTDEDGWPLMQGDSVRHTP